jgi:Leucine-rich repeat (LRR) protein
MSDSDDDSIPPPPPPPPPLPPSAVADEELEIQSTPVLERLKSGGKFRTDSRQSGRFSRGRFSRASKSPYEDEEVDIDSIERGADGSKSSTKKRKCILFLTALLLVGGGVGAALGIILTKNKNTNAAKSSGAGDDASTTDAPTSGNEEDGTVVDPIAEETITTPTTTTPENYVKEDVALEILRQMLPTKAYTALSDPYIDSAQSSALDFILNDDEFVYDWDGLASTPIDPDAQINFIQRYTAATLFLSTQGKNWNNNEGWMGRMNVCTWFGVVCDENGLVTSLSLSDNNLMGPIPADLKTLGNLHTIELHKNLLSGQIPSSLFEMNELKILYLDGNQLEGGISDSIGQMSKLEKLTLNDNQLSGDIPSTIGELDNLDMLWLYNNPAVTGNIPAEIGNCQKLSEYML